MQPVQALSVWGGVHAVRTFGAFPLGVGAEIVCVEARFEAIDRTSTEVLITGLPDPVIRESRSRLLAALSAHGLRIRSGRLHLNLMPAGLKKIGGALDLPMAVAATAAAGYLPARCVRDVLLFGELGLDGTLHSGPGALLAALAARDAGLPEFIGNAVAANQAAWIADLVVRPGAHLGEVVAHLAGKRPLPPVQPSPDSTGPESMAKSKGGATKWALDQVRGQAQAKFALAVAAAGGHGLLLSGPPGAGKSLLARAFVQLLPPPNLAERLAITQVQSAAGEPHVGLVQSRPFRAPHHTISYAGLVGGGPQIRPGEITRAHCGVLFLDELPEFKRDVLECLRQPLEHGSIVISRASAQVTLPSRFQLVAAMNPCPCGFRGHPRRPCTCSPHAVLRYRQRISGPLLDRIDLRLEVQPSDWRTWDREEQEGPRATEWIARIQSAVERSNARQGARQNAQLGTEELDRYAPLNGKARTLLERAEEARPFSARALQSLRRVAITLADLEGVARPEVRHITQALALRAPLVS